MSTKLHNGYRLNMGERDLSDLIEIFREAQEDFIEIGREVVIEESVSRATLHNDGYHLGFEEEQINIGETKSDIRDELESNERYEFLPKADVNVFPFRDHQFLALFHSHMDEMTDRWEEFPFVEDYGWGNQTGHTIQGITKQEYDRRKHHWREAFLDHGRVPDEVGWTYVFSNIRHMTFFFEEKHRDAIEESIPDKEDRLFYVMKSYQKKYSDRNLVGSSRLRDRIDNREDFGNDEIADELREAYQKLPDLSSWKDLYPNMPDDELSF